MDKSLYLLLKIIGIVIGICGLMVLLAIPSLMVLYGAPNFRPNQSLVTK